MTKNIDDQINLAKVGMVEKGKDVAPGLWLNPNKGKAKAFNDYTTISIGMDNHNADNFKNL